ncbi:hypothetical protein Emag_004903 [Eimeria magna]
MRAQAAATGGPCGLTGAPLTCVTVAKTSAMRPPSILNVGEPPSAGGAAGMSLPGGVGATTAARGGSSGGGPQVGGSPPPSGRHSSTGSPRVVLSLSPSPMASPTLSASIGRPRGAPSFSHSPLPHCPPLPPSQDARAKISSGGGGNAFGSAVKGFDRPSGAHTGGPRAATTQEGPVSAYKVPLYKDGSLGEGLWLIAGPSPSSVAARGPLLKSVKKLIEANRRTRGGGGRGGGSRGGPQALQAAKADALIRRLDSLASQEADLAVWGLVLCGCREASKRQKGPRKTGASGAPGSVASASLDGASAAAAAATATGGGAAAATEAKSAEGRGASKEEAVKASGALNLSLGGLSSSAGAPLFVTVPRVSAKQRHLLRDEATQAFDAHVRQKLTAQLCASAESLFASAESLLEAQRDPAGSGTSLGQAVGGEAVSFLRRSLVATGPPSFLLSAFEADDNYQKDGSTDGSLPSPLARQEEAVVALGLGAANGPPLSLAEMLQHEPHKSRLREDVFLYTGPCRWQQQQKQHQQHQKQQHSSTAGAVGEGGRQPNEEALASGGAAGGKSSVVSGMSEAACAAEIPSYEALAAWCSSSEDEMGGGLPLAGADSYSQLYVHRGSLSWGLPCTSDPLGMQAASALGPLPSALGGVSGASQEEERVSSTRSALEQHAELLWELPRELSAAAAAKWLKKRLAAKRRRETRRLALRALALERAAEAGKGPTAAAMLQQLRPHEEAELQHIKQHLLHRYKIEAILRRRKAAARALKQQRQQQQQQQHPERQQQQEQQAAQQGGQQPQPKGETEQQRPAPQQQAAHPQEQPQAQQPALQHLLPHGLQQQQSVAQQELQTHQPLQPQLSPQQQAQLQQQQQLQQEPRQQQQMQLQQQPQLHQQQQPQLAKQLQQQPRLQQQVQPPQLQQQQQLQQGQLRHHPLQQPQQLQQQGLLQPRPHLQQQQQLEPLSLLAQQQPLQQQTHFQQEQQLPRQQQLQQQQHLQPPLQLQQQQQLLPPQHQQLHQLHSQQKAPVIQQQQLPHQQLPVQDPLLARPSVYEGRAEVALGGGCQAQGDPGLLLPVAKLSQLLLQQKLQQKLRQRKYHSLVRAGSHALSGLA